MASLTMSFTRIDGRGADTSQHVFLLRNWFKMIRVHTRSIATQMIQLIAFGNFRFEKFKRKSMGVNIFSISNKNTIIGILTTRFSADPKPTSIGPFIDSHPKFLFNRWSNLFRMKDTKLSSIFRSSHSSTCQTNSVGRVRQVLNISWNQFMSIFTVGFISIVKTLYHNAPSLSCRDRAVDTNLIRGGYAETDRYLQPVCESRFYTEMRVA